MRSISRTRVIVLTAAIALMALSLSWYSGEAGTGDEANPGESVDESELLAGYGESGLSVRNIPLSSGTVNVRGSGSYDYEVCEAGTDTCSNTVTCSTAPR